MSRHQTELNISRAAQADINRARSGSHCCAPVLTHYVPPPSGPRAPSLLPLKRLCSLSRRETAITDSKFGVYIINIYISVEVIKKDLSIF